MDVDEHGPNESALKKPMQSKKFVAFLVAEITWKIIITVVVIMGMKDSDIDLMIGSIVLACVAIAGFVEALYVGGQAALDKYIRIADIATRAGAGLSMRGIDIKPPQGNAVVSDVSEVSDDRSDGENFRGPHGN